MSLNYPGPRENVTGEYDECDHGVPTCYPCPDCLQKRYHDVDEALAEAEAEIARLQARVGEHRDLLHHLARILGGIADDARNSGEPSACAVLAEVLDRVVKDIEAAGAATPAERETDG